MNPSRSHDLIISRTETEVTAKTTLPNSTKAVLQHFHEYNTRHNL